MEASKGFLNPSKYMKNQVITDDINLSGFLQGEAIHMLILVATWPIDPVSEKNLIDCCKHSTYN